MTSFVRSTPILTSAQAIKAAKSLDLVQTAAPVLSAEALAEKLTRNCRYQDDRGVWHESGGEFIGGITVSLGHWTKTGGTEVLQGPVAGLAASASAAVLISESIVKPVLDLEPLDLRLPLLFSIVACTGGVENKDRRRVTGNISFGDPKFDGEPITKTTAIVPNDGGYLGDIHIYAPIKRENGDDGFGKVGKIGLEQSKHNLAFLTKCRNKSYAKGLTAMLSVNSLIKAFVNGNDLDVLLGD